MWKKLFKGWGKKSGADAAPVAPARDDYNPMEGFGGAAGTATLADEPAAARAERELPATVPFIDEPKIPLVRPTVPKDAPPTIGPAAETTRLGAKGLVDMFIAAPALPAESRKSNILPKSGPIAELIKLFASQDAKTGKPIGKTDMVRWVMLDQNGERTPHKSQAAAVRISLKEDSKFSSRPLNQKFDAKEALQRLAHAIEKPPANQLRELKVVPVNVDHKIDDVSVYTQTGNIAYTGPNTEKGRAVGHYSLTVEAHDQTPGALQTLISGLEAQQQLKYPER